MNAMSMCILSNLIATNCLKSRFETKCLRYFYDWRTRSETIFALATSIRPVKGSPLGIIRLSGPKTFNCLQLLTKLEPHRPDAVSQSVSKRNILLPRYARLTKIFDPKAQDLIDIGIVLWFPSPDSYTGEDACEFHVHGSQAIIKKLLSILGSQDGLRPAEPGEFTRRAVENGKITLMQAESLSELISAQTDHQRMLALKGLDGSTRKKYANWIATLVSILAHLEASIDFGEDELIGEQKVVSDCTQKLRALSSEIGQFITIASQCRDIVQTGAKVSILGRPNAGKSTLMNILCRREKSIVSDLSGTTRDVIEHSFDLNGHALTLCDTAGLKDLNSEQAQRSLQQYVIGQHDSIEREGIRRALQTAKNADLILYIVDGSQFNLMDIRDAIIEELIQVLDYLDKDQRTQVIHLIINKIDLNNEISTINYEALLESIQGRIKSKKILISTVSCKTQENFNLLVEQISNSLDQLRPNLSAVDGEKMDYVNERHLSLLGSTLKHLGRASKMEIKNIDEMAQHVRESVDYLSRIVGSVTNEQVIDIIFRDFCIGK